MDTDKTVVITGSASGIGQATAAEFLRDGATVYGLDRSPQQPDPTPSGTAGTWVPRTLDVADLAGVEAVFGQIIQEAGRIDVLVTSAGVGYPEPFLQITPESWDKVFAINVTGTMACIKAALPTLLEQRNGNIVVISSVAGRTKSVANGAHYTASKYGLIGLTRHVAAELAGTGVRINCVAPGPTNSPILTANASEHDVEQLVQKTPLRRIAEPEDVAATIAFVADDRARHIHGAIIDVNGGLY